MKKKMQIESKAKNETKTKQKKKHFNNDEKKEFFTHNSHNNFRIKKRKK